MTEQNSLSNRCRKISQGKWSVWRKIRGSGEKICKCVCVCVPVDWLCNQCHRLLSITKDRVEVAVEIKGSVSLYGQRRPAVDLRDKSLSRPRTADAVAAAGAEEVAV